MFSTKQIFSILGAASMALASPIDQGTVVSLNTTAIASPGFYPTVCNDQNLNVGDMYQCISWMQARGGSCNVDGGGAHFCNQGGVKVEGYPYGGESKTGMPCDPYVTGAVQDIINRCGSRGGSAQAGDNEHLIIHVNSFWF